jgi:glycosyltransferase involved in cell wall biosynthesis
MRGVLVNTSFKGGASKSAQRLFCGLQILGMDVDFLAKNHKGSEHRIIDKYSLAESNRFFIKIEKKLKNLSKIKNEYDKYLLWRTHNGAEKFSGLKSNIKIDKVINKKNFEFVNLHWVADFLDYNSFFKSCKLPIFWTLHDESPYSFGEHYNQKLIVGLNGMIQEREISDLEKKIQGKIRKQKLEIFEKVNNLTIIGPSRWICEQSKNSEIFEKYKTYNIPNGLNTDVFRLWDKELCKSFLNILKENVTLLFVADSLENHRKGFRILLRSLEMLGNVKLNIMLIGTDKPKDLKFSDNHKVYSLGTVIDERVMSMVYNAADLFIIPSLMDNLPNTAIESICCGTPIIGFDIGGIPDIVEDGVNGTLVQKICPEQLAVAILNGITNLEIFNNIDISLNATEKYKLERQALRYIELFEGKVI